jgi:hypothetical protein
LINRPSVDIDQPGECIFSAPLASGTVLR